MKKILATLLTVIAAACTFGACEGLKKKNSSEGSDSSQSEVSAVVSSDETSLSQSSYSEGSSASISSFETSSSAADSSSSVKDDASSEDSNSSVADSSSSSGSSTETDRMYVDFTAGEKAEMIEYIGEVIPFIPNDEYYVECYYDEEYEDTVNFYTFDNTEEEFEAYLDKFSSWTFDGTDVDEYGDTWYFYSKDELAVDVTYYYYEGAYVMDLYAYVPATYIPDDSSSSGEDSSYSKEDSSSADSSKEDSSSEDSSSSSGSSAETEHEYVDFTDSEKSEMIEYIGEVIPFIPNDEYYVECYYDEEYEDTVNFYTFDNTEEEFEAYLDKFSSWTFDGTDVDEYGDTWYFYSKGELAVDITYYYYEGAYVMDLYAYISGGGTPDDGWGDDVGGGYDDVDLITNNGKGLPASENGVYEVDFTKAKYVKDVHDQGYYIDGCPTTGTLNVLVIPVEFKDVTAASKGYQISKLEKAFNGGSGDTDYFSVKEYYALSSYGQLDVNFVVLDSWFKPQQSSSYYAQAKTTIEGTEIAIGDQMIMDEALAYLSTIMNLADFDADGNGIIDGVVMINTLDINYEVDFQWAYRYWNYYLDENDEYYVYDGVSANDYLWAPYQFLYDDGYGDYSDTSLVNTYTFIHEFAHVLGSDDYYDTSELGMHPMDGYDVMDAMPADHNPYTKFNYGWLTESRLIAAEDTVTLTLEAFAENGDTIIIANDWDEELGVYQEYFILSYYTNGGLNKDGFGLFEEEGIVVYHVNASLYIEEYQGETYYHVYNTNTNESASNGYGTADNLIEFVTMSNGEYVYGVGDSLSANTKNDSGDKIAYIFTVDALTGNSATLTFTKNA